MPVKEVNPTPHSTGFRQPCKSSAHTPILLIRLLFFVNLFFQKTLVL